MTIQENPNMYKLEVQDLHKRYGSHEVILSLIHI